MSWFFCLCGLSQSAMGRDPTVVMYKHIYKNVGVASTSVAVLRLAELYTESIAPASLKPFPCFLGR